MGDAVELLEQGAGAGLVEGDGAGFCAEQGLCGLEPIGGSAGCDDPRAFDFGGLRGRKPMPELPPRITTVLCANDMVPSAWLLLPRYIPLISSRIAPSGSLKQTTPIVAPSGPLIFLSGAKHWTFFACRSA